MSENLPEALGREISRCSFLLQKYETIPTGAFGAAVIRASISAGVNALGSSPLGVALFTENVNLGGK